MKNNKNIVTMIVFMVTVASSINAQVMNIDWLNNGNSTQSNEIVENVIHDKSDLNEEELEKLDRESVNNYLTSFYNGLETGEMPENLNDYKETYKFLENQSSSIKEAGKYELYQMVSEWMSDANSIEEFRVKLRSSKTDIIKMKNGIHFYFTLDYSLQILVNNQNKSNSKSAKKGHDGDCQYNVLVTTASGATLGSFIPVIGTVAGGFFGAMVGLMSDACN